MMGIGVVELVVLIPLVLLSTALPVVAIVLLVMINRKVNQIGQRLNGQRG